MRAYLARWATHDGSRGTCTVIAPSSCDAVVAILDAIAGIRRLSVSPA